MAANRFFLSCLRTATTRQFSSLRSLSNTYLAKSSVEPSRAPLNLINCRRVIPTAQYSTENRSDASAASRVLECIKQYDKLTTSDVKLDSRFKEDLSMDSLDHVEMIMLLEDEFGFEIPDADAEKLTTPNDIVVYIMKKLPSS